MAEVKLKKLLMEWLEGSNGRVSVEEVARNKYGRLLVNLKNKDDSINLTMREGVYKDRAIMRDEKAAASPLSTPLGRQGGADRDGH